MADKKEKQTQKQKEELNQVFEIHTMAKDNELRQDSDNTNDSKKTSKKSILGSQNKKPLIAKKVQKKSTEPNPFLTEEVKGEITTVGKEAQNVQQKQEGSKKGSFAPQIKKDFAEETNQTPADIASKVQKSKSVKQSKKSKNIVKIMMIIFIILFILGAIGVVVWIFVFDKQKVSVESNQQTMPETVEDVIDKSTAESEQPKKTYSTDMPNYFVLNVESQTSDSDIVAEFTKIEKTIIADDIVEPVAFTVNDTNGNPVSFHIFALSAGMNIPQEIASSLEEEFDLYAYNDPEHGVRFGFVINVKNPNLLQEALKENEVKLPQAFSIILDETAIATENTTFNDGVYKTYPIRYTNLNSTESYSIDYVVSNLQLVVGSSRHTIRAILEDVRGGIYNPENNDSVGLEADVDLESNLETKVEEEKVTDNMTDATIE
ncbi:MAG: hypothetical protein CR972_03225 [Candidatus Moraniibacteriota bacterium]|nr:MAG: hypothetical protein CR972_03225 [Candidatus Moranbacteria bacterium]